MTIPKLEWKYDAKDNCWIATIPARDFHGLGCYQFVAVERPPYCDRGRFLVQCFSSTISSLDSQEGFPRYYFKLENLQQEIQLWCEGREEIQAAHNTTT